MAGFSRFIACTMGTRMFSSTKICIPAVTGGTGDTPPYRRYLALIAVENRFMVLRRREGNDGVSVRNGKDRDLFPHQKLFNNNLISRRNRKPSPS